MFPNLVAPDAALFANQAIVERSISGDKIFDQHAASYPSKLEYSFLTHSQFHAQFHARARSAMHATDFSGALVHMRVDLTQWRKQILWRWRRVSIRKKSDIVRQHRILDFPNQLAVNTGVKKK